MAHRKYRSFVLNYYLFRFLTDFALIYPVYLIFFRRHGLSVLDISILLALWCAFVLLLEIPAGVLADRWNRKAMLGLGLLFKAAGFGIWMISSHFWHFAMGFLFWAVQESFCSGTQEAVLYEGLHVFQKESQYERITGKALFLSKMGAALAVLLGSILASYRMDYTLFLSVLAMLGAAISVLFFPYIEKPPITHKKQSWRMISVSIREIKKCPPLRHVVWFTIFVLAIVGSADEFDQLYLEWIGLPLQFFGIFLMFRIVLEGLGNHVGHKFSRIPIRYSFPGSGLLVGLFIGLAALFPGIWLLPVLGMIFFIYGIGEVLLESQVQRNIQKNRATILSMYSFLDNFAAIFFMLGFGILSRFVSLQWGFLFLAVLAVGYSIIIKVTKVN